MPKIAIFTDSASDMPPELAAQVGVTVVPLIVSFGKDSYEANVTMSTAQFWERMLAPDAPFPTTAAAAPGTFAKAYQAAFDAGAEAIISIHVSSDLSGTIKSALVAKAGMPDREIHVIDTRSVSAGQIMLCQMAAEMAATGASAAEIVEMLELRKQDIIIYIALDTLEYLKRGGRISGAQAVVGSVLSIRPIISVVDGKVVNHERVRSSGKARERALELTAATPLERATVLHTTRVDFQGYRDELQRRSGLPDEMLQVITVGPSVGPHIGPGSVGAVAIAKR